MLRARPNASAASSRLFGVEPTFYSNNIEAVWQLAEDRYVYIIQDANRAGGAVSMVWVDDPSPKSRGSPSGGWNRSTSRSTIKSGSTSSTTPTETKRELVGRFQRLSRSGQDQLKQPDATRGRCAPLAAAAMPLSSARR